MKVEQLPQQESFNPISLVLTFESKEEWDTLVDVVSNISPFSMEQAREKPNRPFSRKAWSRISTLIFQQIKKTNERVCN